MPYPVLGTTWSSRSQEAKQEVEAARKNVEAVGSLAYALNIKEQKAPDLWDLIFYLRAVFESFQRHLNGEASAPPAWNTSHEIMCPLTVLLKHVARDIKDPAANVEWGPATNKIRLTLESLNGSLENRGRKWYPGLASCFIFHDSQNNQYLVASSAARYQNFKEMKNFSIGVRTYYHEFLLNRCTPQSRQRLHELEQNSDDVYRHYQNKAGDKHWKNPFETKGAKYSMKGTIATFNAIGQYKPACLLDYTRLQVDHPPQAELLEKEENASLRQAFPARACAEYELVVLYEIHYGI